jgi:4-carboxymuconolactone decarboxylase
MARVPYLDVAEMPEALQKALAGQPPLNIFRAVANAPAPARGFLALGGALLGRGELDPTLRELVIIRVGILSGSAYEVHQHKQVARLIGIPESKVGALSADPNSHVFEPIERDVLSFTDAVVKDVKAPEALFAPVAAALSDAQLVELLLLIGYYTLVSRFLENLEIEIEDVELINTAPFDG